jgi:hypothetical protein
MATTEKARDWGHTILYAGVGCLLSETQHLGVGVCSKSRGLVEGVWIGKQRNLQIIARSVEDKDGKGSEILEDNSGIKRRDNGGCLFRQRSSNLVCRVFHAALVSRDLPDRREQKLQSWKVGCCQLLPLVEFQTLTVGSATACLLLSPS